MKIINLPAQIWDMQSFKAYRPLIMYHTTWYWIPMYMMYIGHVLWNTNKLYVIYGNIFEQIKCTHVILRSPISEQDNMHIHLAPFLVGLWSCLESWVKIAACMLFPHTKSSIEGHWWSILLLQLNLLDWLLSIRCQKTVRSGSFLLILEVFSFLNTFL